MREFIEKDMKGKRRKLDKGGGTSESQSNSVPVGQGAVAAESDQAQSDSQQSQQSQQSQSQFNLPLKTIVHGHQPSGLWPYASVAEVEGEDILQNADLAFDHNGVSNSDTDSDSESSSDHSFDLQTAPVFVNADTSVHGNPNSARNRHTFTTVIVFPNGEFLIKGQYEMRKDEIIHDVIDSNTGMESIFERATKFSLPMGSYSRGSPPSRSEIINSKNYQDPNDPELFTNVFQPHIRPYDFFIRSLDYEFEVVVDEPQGGKFVNEQGKALPGVDLSSIEKLNQHANKLNNGNGKNQDLNNSNLKNVKIKRKKVKQSGPWPRHMEIVMALEDEDHDDDPETPSKLHQFLHSLDDKLSGQSKFAQDKQHNLIPENAKDDSWRKVLAEDLLKQLNTMSYLDEGHIHAGRFNWIVQPYVYSRQDVVRSHHKDYRRNPLCEPHRRDGQIEYRYKCLSPSTPLSIEDPNRVFWVESPTQDHPYDDYAVTNIETGIEIMNRDLDPMKLRYGRGPIGKGRHYLGPGEKRKR